MTDLTELSGAVRAAAGSWLARLARHQRAVTAALTGLAVLAGLTALRPAEGRTVAVLAVAHEVAGGTVLGPADVLTVRLPARLVPDGALTPADELAGRTVAAPMARGEVLTATRLAGTSLLTGADGRVGVPVRIADAGAAALLRAGDRVDLLAAPRDGGAAVVAATGVEVLVVPAPAPGLDEGALLVVACTPATAQRLATAAVSSRISVVLRGH